MYRYHAVRILNTLWIFVLCGVLIGAYTYQFEEHQNPCPLCELQRLSMICISIGLILNLKHGIKMRHYALSLAASILGGAISLRQICLHICPQFPTFGYPVFGMELYTWAFIVFVCGAIGLTLLLILHKAEDEKPHHRLYPHEHVAIFLIFIIACMNVVTTLMECGIGPCLD